MVDLIWLVPAFPLAGFLLIGLGKKFLSNQASAYLASTAVLASFILSVIIGINLPEKPVTVDLFNWFTSGDLNISFSFLIDRISLIMLLIITGVGFLIHVYSVGYMNVDEGVSRFFGYLNLFVFFMLILVLGSNYIVMFAGWEGVGLCSYLLIGFWFKNTSYNLAANKAFIMNRIGDLGFLLGIILIYTTFGSVSFDKVFAGTGNFSTDQPVIVAITLLLFIGAMGKSAQIPLYTWLPDAMAGPTPVSALIHAATMVTAGVYMIVRSNLLYSIAPFTLNIIAIVGGITAVFSAAIALAQTDIKKVLAYSTVSQLGFMFVALGVGAYSTALFHVTTHAFFKALLFLAAGNVIHSMSGEQDIRRMGGLKTKLPVTFIVFLIGTLAISGIPPFAGFFSKDEILAKVWFQNKIVFVVLAITTLMTSFYMFRLFFLTFYGKFRGTQQQEHHLHESPKVMTIPLMLLALLSTFGGCLGLPSVFSHTNWFENILHPLAPSPVMMVHSEMDHSFEWILMIGSVALVSLMIYLAYRRFVKQAQIPALHENEFNTPQRVLFNKAYVDELYEAIIIKPLYTISRFFYSIIDVRIIDGLINGISRSVNWSSGRLRLVQTGYTGFYIFAMVFGIIAILIINLFLK